MTMGDEARDARLPPSDIKMSLVVVSPGNYSTIRMTVSFLAEQTMCGLLELVIVAPSRDELGLLVSEVAGFHSVQIIEVGAVVFRGRASAAGVRAARGPIVAMVENHAFPQRGWAEALVEAHDGPWVGVCPQNRDLQSKDRVQSGRTNHRLRHLGRTRYIEGDCAPALAQRVVQA